MLNHTKNNSQIIIIIIIKIIIMIIVIAVIIIIIAIIITIITTIIIIKGSSNLPPQGKSTPTIPQMEVPMETAKGYELSIVVTKASTSEVAGILDPLHFYVSAT